MGEYEVSIYFNNDRFVQVGRPPSYLCCCCAGICVRCSGLRQWGRFFQERSVMVVYPKRQRAFISVGAVCRGFFSAMARAFLYFLFLLCSACNRSGGIVRAVSHSVGIAMVRRDSSLRSRRTWRSQCRDVFSGPNEGLSRSPTRRDAFPSRRHKYSARCCL